ncbi:hypothetical protein EKH57_18020 (plasmid) [Halorubrum sp. BOL3-1]|uniref:hypothetical protein n=1 Tax=Halorubrum sp. BOL3-1 TaxID=2497325 RepID=UPI001004E5EF|nr:hypothetical protein [Halorubrum sp. BOL3-1]QAU14567.1 hypothetical protein EKH57_18020 [Halorubrum sp. BOL3-1]
MSVEDPPLGNLDHFPPIVDTRLAGTPTDPIHVQANHNRELSWLQSGRGDKTSRFDTVSSLSEAELERELEEVEEALDGLGEENNSENSRVQASD